MFIGIINGFRRGAILQLGHWVALIISFLVANAYYRDLAEAFKLWIPYPSQLDGSLPEGVIDLNALTGLEMTFYNVFWFVVLFVITKLVLHLILSMLDFLTDLPILRQLKGIIGAVLGFFEAYVITFFILWVIAFVPMASVQSAVDNSSLATYIIQDTPYLSEWFSNKML
ncbi:CvpA family protein [Exiguobacterium aurantiacum]|uniref:CvpA family protein n=1 Tax=Exiguobacterium aurantiacum TaxID=33987 RepID=A0ABY5FKR3_9BACL|nr:CvpA family protein [Exiguobacterium aurantiacum]